MTTPASSRPPGVRIMRSLGLEPDPWQVEVLEGDHPHLLLNCCRQAGKSTVVAILGLVEAMFVPFTKVLLVSRSMRQGKELFRRVIDFYRRLNRPMRQRDTAQELELSNGSQIFCVPCREDTIRGYSDIGLLVIDEAARVPDDLYRAVRPMLAVSKGRLICLSTPYGKKGFFHHAWSVEGDDWHRIRVPADQVSRIEADFLAQERRALGEAWFRQEYQCSFEALEGLVYPEFDQAMTTELPFAEKEPWPGRRVGGIDFGFRNPFAAVWGVHDRDGVLWLLGEHYERQKPISHHAGKLPRDVTWYADPAGAQERAALHIEGLAVKRGKNALRAGIGAVSARLQNGTLKILEGRCPHLLHEAGLYRYGEDPADRRGESPVDDHNHALDALRYLVASLPPVRAAAPAPTPTPPPPRHRSWIDDDDDEDDPRWIRLA